MDLAVGSRSGLVVHLKKTNYGEPSTEGIWLFVAAMRMLAASTSACWRAGSENETPMTSPANTLMGVKTGLSEARMLVRRIADLAKHSIGQRSGSGEGIPG
jgi:hypothetical protein